MQYPDFEIRWRNSGGAEHAAEDAASHVRYLRPAYQAPGSEQATLALPAAAATAVAVTATGPQAWPTELAQQMQALRDALQQAAQPQTAAQVAAGFKRLKADKMEPLLATLPSQADPGRSLRGLARAKAYPLIRIRQMVFCRAISCCAASAPHRLSQPLSSALPFR